MEPLLEALGRIRGRAEEVRREPNPARYHSMCWELVDSALPLIEACEILADFAENLHAACICAEIGAESVCPKQFARAALSAAAQRLGVVERAE